MKRFKPKRKKNRLPDMGNYKTLSRRALVKRYLNTHNAAIEYHQHSLDAHAKEWVALKRAMKAEKQVEKLKKQLLDNGIQPE